MPRVPSHSATDSAKTRNRPPNAADGHAKLPAPVQIPKTPAQTPAK